MITLVITNQIKFGWLLLFGKQIVYWIFHIFFNEVSCNLNLYKKNIIFIIKKYYFYYYFLK